MTRIHPDKPTYFTFLRPPPRLRARFNAVAAGAPESAEIKRADDLHITLNYLQIPRARPKRDLIERLAQIEFPAFDIHVTGLDSFYRIPRKNLNTHVIWGRPDGLSSWNIRDLHAKILLALRPVGYNVGQLDMTPHMTLMKYPYNGDAEGLHAFLEENHKLRLPKWNCDRFYLGKTMMRDNPKHPDNNGGVGSKYEVIGTFPLKPALK